MFLHIFWFRRDGIVWCWTGIDAMLIVNKHHSYSCDPGSKRAQKWCIYHWLNITYEKTPVEHQLLITLLDICSEGVGVSRWSDTEKINVKLSLPKLSQLMPPCVKAMEMCTRHQEVEYCRFYGQFTESAAKRVEIKLFLLFPQCVTMQAST